MVVFAFLLRSSFFVAAHLRPASCVSSGLLGAFFLPAFFAAKTAARLRILCAGFFRMVTAMAHVRRDGSACDAQGTTAQKIRHEVDDDG